MKKVFLAAVTLISVAFVGNANAQGTSSSDVVTVNIKLKPIHTILVNSGQKTVNLTYATRDNYQNGVGVDQADHLEIFSTGAFEVRVKSNGDFESDSRSILASSVTVTPSNGTANTVLSPNYSAVTLSADSDKQIVNSTKGGRDMKVSINYKGAGSDAYLVDKFTKADGADENVFTADVTYTILAI